MLLPHERDDLPFQREQRVDVPAQNILRRAYSVHHARCGRIQGRCSATSPKSSRRTGCKQGAFGGQYQTTGFGDQEPCGDEAEPRLGIDDGLLECCLGWSPSLQFLFLVEVYIEVSG